MKRIVLGLVGISTMLAAAPLSTANAADMPLKAPPLPLYSWTGCYGGINGGWKWGRFHESVDTAAGTFTIPGVPTTTFAADHLNLPGLTTDSGAVGGQLGCRWESREHWVFGLEGDFDWTDLHGRVVSSTAGTSGEVFVPGDNFGNRARWESSARIIVGRSFDRLLVYATGGAAFTQVTMDANFIATTSFGIPFPASSGSDTRTLAGGTIGAGLAYAITTNLEIGAEYRYSAYERGNFGLGTVAAFCALTTASPAPVCVNTTATGHKDLQTQELLFKIKYRFNLGGPVVANY